jgi:hypothetical protein
MRLMQVSVSRPKPAGDAIGSHQDMPPALSIGRPWPVAEVTPACTIPMGSERDSTTTKRSSLTRLLRDTLLGPGGHIGAHTNTCHSFLLMTG